MKKKSNKTGKVANVVARGVSAPPHLFEWAEKEAKKQNRNLSNYIVSLLLEEKSRKEAEANV